MPVRTSQIVWLSLFAIAMAHVEASLVVHLRSLYYPEDPLTIFPLVLMSHRDLAIELAREMATVVMIVAVAALTAKRFMDRFTVFLYLFGMWDLFYYFWLKVMIGWPVSWGEWDVLFLIPWPWFGPWLTPALIALVFVVWSGYVMLRNVPLTAGYLSSGLFLTGCLLSLSAFLLPGLALLPGGEQAFAGYQPAAFSWRLYLPGLLIMTAGLLKMTSWSHYVRQA